MWLDDMKEQVGILYLLVGKPGMFDRNETEQPQTNTKLGRARDTIETMVRRVGGGGEPVGFR